MPVPPVILSPFLLYSLISHVLSNFPEGANVQVHHMAFIVYHPTLSHLTADSE